MSEVTLSRETVTALWNVTKQHNEDHEWRRLRDGLHADLQRAEAVEVPAPAEQPDLGEPPEAEVECPHFLRGGQEGHPIQVLGCTAHKGPAGRCPYSDDPEVAHLCQTRALAAERVQAQQRAEAAEARVAELEAQIGTVGKRPFLERAWRKCRWDSKRRATMMSAREYEVRREALMDMMGAVDCELADAIEQAGEPAPVPVEDVERTLRHLEAVVVGMVEDNTILMNVRALETTKDFIDALCAKADEEGFTVRVSLKPKPQDAPDEGGEDE